MSVWSSWFQRRLQPISAAQVWMKFLACQVSELGLQVQHVPALITDLLSVSTSVKATGQGYLKSESNFQWETLTEYLYRGLIRALSRVVTKVTWSFLSAKCFVPDLKKLPPGVPEKSLSRDLDRSLVTVTSTFHLWPPQAVLKKPPITRLGPGWTKQKHQATTIPNSPTSVVQSQLCILSPVCLHNQQTLNGSALLTLGSLQTPACWRCPRPRTRRRTATSWVPTRRTARSPSESRYACRCRVSYEIARIWKKTQGVKVQWSACRIILITCWTGEWKPSLLERS